MAAIPEDVINDAMVLNMPRNTAYIQEHPCRTDSPGCVVFRDGELVWSDENGFGKVKIKEEEIVLITGPSRDSTSGYRIFHLSETPEDTTQPYKLSVLPESSLPHNVLEKHLVKGGVPEFLRDLAAHQLHVIVSTRSGTGLAERCYDDVVPPLLAAFGLSPQTPMDLTDYSSNFSSDDEGYDLVVTKSPQSMKQFAQDLWSSCEGEPESQLARQTVVLLSGDGGVVDLLNGASQASADVARPTIAILPLGTGNALFHSLHRQHYKAAEGRPVCSPLVLGLQTLFRGCPAPLPPLRASFSTGSKLVSYMQAQPSCAARGGPAAQVQEHTEDVSSLYGAIVASYGFHAQLVWESDTPEYRKHGDKRFGMVAQELLRESHAYDATVDVRPPRASEMVRLPRDKFAYVLATMVSNLEKTFTISPASQPLDGTLRLDHFGGVGGEKTMEIMMAAYRDGAHVGMQGTAEDGGVDGVGVEVVAAGKVTVREEDARWRKGCSDGTIVVLPHGGWMRVEKAGEPQYRILVR